MYPILTSYGAQLMDFGAFILCQRLSEATQVADVYQQVMDVTALAESVGFTTAWYPEHHLIHYVSCPSPLMMAVKAATHTKRIRVGTAIAVAPYYHPIRLAEEIGFADQLTGGRLEIGIGRGAVNYEFSRFGLDARKASELFFESAKTVQDLLRNEDVASDGPAWSFAPSTSVPRPLQDPFPRMWVAARSPDTIGWSVRNGFNVMTNVGWGEPFSTIEQIGKQFVQFIEAAKPAVRPRFGVSRVAFVADTDKEALEAMKAAQINNRIFMRLFRDQVTVKRGFASPDPIEGEPSPERLFETLIAGSPETCVKKLRQYEALGVDHFMLFVFGPDHESTMKSVRLFGEAVVPHFKKLN